MASSPSVHFIPWPVAGPQRISEGTPLGAHPVQCLKPGLLTLTAGGSAHSLFLVPPTFTPEHPYGFSAEATPIILPDEPEPQGMCFHFTADENQLLVRVFGSSLWEQETHYATAAIDHALKLIWAKRDTNTERMACIEAAVTAIHQGMLTDPHLLGPGEYARVSSPNGFTSYHLHSAAAPGQITRVLEMDQRYGNPERHTVTEYCAQVLPDHGCLVWQVAAEDARYWSDAMSPLFDAPLTGEHIPGFVREILPYLPSAPIACASPQPPQVTDYRVTFTPWPVAAAQAERMSAAPDLWGHLVPGELSVERADGKPENLSLYMAVDDAHTLVPGCFIQVPPEFPEDPAGGLTFSFRRAAQDGELLLVASADDTVWSPNGVEESAVARLDSSLNLTWEVRDTVPGRAELIEAVFEVMRTIPGTVPPIVPAGECLHLPHRFDVAEEFGTYHYCHDGVMVRAFMVGAGWVDGDVQLYQAQVQTADGTGVLVWGTGSYSARYWKAPGHQAYFPPLTGDEIPAPVRALSAHLPPAGSE